jgi:hypothetical protein
MRITTVEQLIEVLQANDPKEKVKMKDFCRGNIFITDVNLENPSNKRKKVLVLSSKV